MPRFESQDPSSFGWPTPPRGDFVDFEFDGHRFPQGVARGTDRLFSIALDRLCHQPGFSLPESRQLDAGMWGREVRRKTSGNGWSFHAYGLAIDVAAPWNPYGSSRPPAHPHRLPANTDDLVRPLGLLWGGTFGDWMHLECHLSPTEVDAFGRRGDSLPTPDAPEGFPLPPGWYYGPRTGPRQSVSNMVNPDPVWIAGLQAAQLVLGVIADGLFGPNTQAAARLWQAAHGLEPDGLIGIRTWTSLFG